MLVAILIGVMLILQGILLWFQLRPRVDAAVHMAVVQALADAGLNGDLAAPTSDLLKTGKLDDVLYHASDHLGNPIRTTGDVELMLTRRFRR